MSARCAIATAMEGVHYVLHAPQGDTYADLLFTMIERRAKRPPVTYTTFQARDLGGDTAELFKTAARDAYERFQPQAMLVGASCTAELIQDDPGGLAKALGLPIPVVPLELPSYQQKENWGAAETFYQLVRALAGPRAAPDSGAREPARGRAATSSAPPRSASATATTSRRSPACSTGSGIDVNVVAPMGATPADLARLGEADFNVVLYPEIAGPAARWLERTFGQPWTQDRADRRRRHPRLRRRGGAARRDRRAGRARGRALAPALVLALGRLDLPHRQARLRLRRRHPRHRRRPRRRAGAGLHGGRASAPTAASSPARSARPPSATASRR